MPIPAGIALAAPASGGLSGTLLGAAGIGAGTSFLGGLLGSSANRKMAERAERFNREVLQNAIQWRVQDARKAGLHPLFALGANVATSGGNPQFIGDPLGPSLAEAGQDISNALVRTQTAEQRMKNQLDLALMAKNIEETDARTQYIRAQQRALEQAGAASPGGLGLQAEPYSGIVGQAINQPGMGIVNVKPSDQVSSHVGDPSTVAGYHPYYQDYAMAEGRLPFKGPMSMGEHPEEVLSEMSLGAYIGWLRMNERKFGPQWTRDFLGWRYGGMEPSGDYPLPGGLGPKGSAVLQSPGAAAVERAIKKMREFYEGKWGSSRYLPYKYNKK